MSMQPTTPQSEFSFARAFARYWRESVRFYGFWRTLRETLSALSRTLLELTPSRRKARYGDLDFDLEQSADTTRANVGFRTQLMVTLVGNPYFASEPWLFEQIMQALPIRFSDFTFIDLGSGKGRALLMAAAYGFPRIIGVEFMPELHRAAEENIHKFIAGHPQASPAQSLDIQSVCMDARDFEFPPGPLVVYLFNPFPEPVFGAVLEDLRRSWQAQPRLVYVAYRYLEFERLLAESGWLEKIAGSEQWAVYRNRCNRTPSPESP